MKQFIAYIFLFVFSFQVLPVKELGQLIFKGQMTEELHECDGADDNNSGNKLKKDIEPYQAHAAEHFSVSEAKYINSYINTAIHISEGLPIWHVPDIFAPPPNC